MAIKWSKMAARPLLAKIRVAITWSPYIRFGLKFLDRRSPPMSANVRRGRGERPPRPRRTWRAPAGVRQRSPRPPRAFAKSADISVLANARHVRRELFGKNFVTFSSKIDRGGRRGRRGRPPTTAAGPPTAGGRVSDRRGPQRTSRSTAANVAVDRRSPRSTAGRPPRPPLARPAVVIF